MLNLLLFFLIFLSSFSNQLFGQADKNQRDLCKEIINLVEKHFYDSTAVSSPTWRAAVQTLLEQVDNSSPQDEVSRLINELLRTLGTSHTYYYSKGHPKRYQLLGVFNALFDQAQEDLFCYEGIGIDLQMVEETPLIISLFDGFPAQQAGLQFGDRILSVDGKSFHPIQSFKGQLGKKVKMEIDRNGNKLQKAVEVVRLDGRTMFEDAARASARSIDYQDKKIGYIHIWSYAGTQYQDILREHILWGNLSTCDALILDLRDGWGGADLNYLNLFRAPIANVSSSDREGNSFSYSGVWEKPVVLLVNERSTSGKELLTFGFKKLKLGAVVGSKTAGAVVAGRIFLLSNGDALYLAVRDVRIDGVRLEGQGVAPDVFVDRPLFNENQEDEQIKAALKEAFRLIKAE